MRGMVVDENVVMDAVKGKKPGRDPALAEAQFMLKLLDSGHPLFVNGTIIKKYRGIEQKVDMRGHPADLNNCIYRVFMQKLADSRSTSHVDGIPVDWPGLKKCDKVFVGVALQSGGILVTDDTRLRKVVEDHPLGSRITCVTARHALDLFDV